MVTCYNKNVLFPVYLTCGQHLHIRWHARLVTRIGSQEYSERINVDALFVVGGKCKQ